MKNRKKALIIAMICLAAAAVLYLLVVKMNQKEANSESDDSNDSLVISSVDSGQITAISYEKDGKSLSFIKEDGTWYDAEDKKFPVNQDSLTTMTNTLGAVSATRKLEKPEALSEYGLDSPVLTVRYTASDGKEAEFIVGDTNDAAGGAYLKTAGTMRSIWFPQTLRIHLIQISISWLTWKAFRPSHQTALQISV